MRVDLATVTLSIASADGECSATLFYSLSTSTLEDPLFAPLLSAALTSFLLDDSETISKQTVQTSNPFYFRAPGGLAFLGEGGGNGGAVVFWSKAQDPGV